MTTNINKGKKITLHVAIPSSSLVNDKTLRDKTLKISKFARAFSIFGVSQIFIYKDDTLKHDHIFTKKNKKWNLFHGKADESLFLKFILEYLDTPQYLRKILYPMSPELRYAGLLEPLNAPHHKKKTRIDEIKEGDVRVGIVTHREDEPMIFKKNSKYAHRNNYQAKKTEIKGNSINFSSTRTVDIGLDYKIPFKGNNRIGQKVNVKLIGKFPDIIAVEASNNDLDKEYWGYQVSISPSLFELLDMHLNKKFILLTSRKGKNLKDNESNFKNLLKNYNNNLLVVYGSPKKDLNEICKNIHMIVKNNSGMYANMFSGQYTETIRLEEAILGSLSIVNYILK